MSFDGVCDRCGSEMDAAEINVEAFEMTGQVLCEECAVEVFEEDDDD